MSTDRIQVENKDLSDLIALVVREKKKLEELKNSVNSMIDHIKDELDDGAYEADDIKFTLCTTSTQGRIDTEKLKEDYPDIYKKCFKPSFGSTRRFCIVK